MKLYIYNECAFVQSTTYLHELHLLLTIHICNKLLLHTHTTHV